MRVIEFTNVTLQVFRKNNNLLFGKLEFSKELPQLEFFKVAEPWYTRVYGTRYLVIKVSEIFICTGDYNTWLIDHLDGTMVPE